MLANENGYASDSQRQNKLLRYKHLYPKWEALRVSWLILIMIIIISTSHFRSFSLPILAELSELIVRQTTFLVYMRVLRMC